MNFKFLIATQNKGKLDEFCRILSPGYQWLIPPVSIPVLEDGKSYGENAFKKAYAYYERFRIPVLSDDSGLEIDCLEGAPGIESARFGGEHADWPSRWALLEKKLQAFPRPWKGRFRAVLCFLKDENDVHYFEGMVSGTIHLPQRGDRGFGYDPIFLSGELGKTFGEASPSEKDRVSHRARALQKFKEWANERP